MSHGEPYDRTFDEDIQATDRNDCPECDGRVTTNAHETVCEDCGLVLDRTPIDHGAAPAFPEELADDESTRRTSPPLTPTQHDRGLATRLARADRDGQDNTLSASQRRRANRLRREQGRTVRRSTAEQNRMAAIYEIRRVTSRLELGTAIREQACRLFRTAQSEGLLPGRSVEAMAAACVYAACRCTKRPTTLADIRPVAGESGTALETAYQVLNETLALPTPPRQPREFIPQLVAELDPPDRQAIERTAGELAEQAAEAGYSVGKHPRGVAAGCVYAAFERHHLAITQQAIADLADVSTPTLRTHWRAVADLDGAE